MKSSRRKNAVLALAARNGWFCAICGCALSLDGDGAAKATVDHIVPRSRGGGNNLGNLRLACKPCNVRRGNALAFPLTPRQARLMGA